MTWIQAGSYVLRGETEADERLLWDLFAADRVPLLLGIQYAGRHAQWSVQWPHAEGYVIDGAIRDVAAIAADGYPVFARSVIHRGPYKSGPGEINVPVSVGGMVISPGDIVVGDEDGVVSFSQSAAPALLEAVNAQIAREEATLLAIREGRYQGSYGKS